MIAHSQAYNIANIASCLILLSPLSSSWEFNYFHQTISIFKIVFYMVDTMRSIKCEFIIDNILDIVLSSSYRSNSIVQARQI
jgi:uncharacterized membrane protein